MAKNAGTGTFVVATDGSPPSERAVDYAADLAQRFGARLQVVHVLELHVYGLGTGALGPQLATVLPDVERAAEGVAGSAAARARERGADAEARLLRAHEAASAIARHAEAVGAGLVFVGSHGRTGLPRILLGSVAERVVRLAPCPVLVVR